MGGFNYLLIVIVFEFKEICFTLVEVKASKSSPLRFCNNNKEKGEKNREEWRYLHGIYQNMTPTPYTPKVRQN